LALSLGGRRIHWRVSVISDNLLLLT
jgi:hypothetical protein